MCESWKVLVNLSAFSHTVIFACHSLFWIWYTSFQLWLKKRGEGVRIRMLYMSCPFCVCQPVSTRLACLCVSVSEPKQKVKAALQKEENPVLHHSWTSILQKHISKQPGAVWVYTAAPQWDLNSCRPVCHSQCYQHVGTKTRAPFHPHPCSTCGCHCLA